MSTLYLIALGAVAVAILAALFDAVLSASRKSAWPTRVPIMMLVATTERRKGTQPFVGVDRRAQDVPASPAEPQRLTA